MARPLRIEFPNAYYHVSNKAEAPHILFPGDQFYQAFLTGVLEAAARLNVEVHSWCLLKNEYHLLVKTPEGNLSRFMRQVDGLYTQTYQRLKRRSGSVFKARYKSVLFQPERYLLQLSRYLHSLPSSMRQNAANWRWSSMQAYVGGGSTVGAAAATQELSPVRSEVLTQLGSGNRPGARYAVYMEQGVDAELLHFYSKKNQLSILGDDKFRAKARAALAPADTRGASKGALAKKRPSLTRIVGRVAVAWKVSPNSIVQAARGPGSKNIPRWAAMYLCQESGGITLQIIAEHFGLQRYGTVSTTIGKLKAEMAADPKLLRTVQALRKELTVA